MATVIILSILIFLILIYILIQNFKITNKVPAKQFEDIVIAHRGYRALYPENTLEAMEQAHLAGADGVEFDLRLSKDYIPVVIHDRKVERTTNGGGKVHELTYDEIKKFKARFKKKLYNKENPLQKESKRCRTYQTHLTLFGSGERSLQSLESQILHINIGSVHQT